MYIAAIYEYCIYIFNNISRMSLICFYDVYWVSLPKIIRT